VNIIRVKACQQLHYDLLLVTADNGLVIASYEDDFFCPLGCQPVASADDNTQKDKS
jgi:hypothetical protein